MCPAGNTLLTWNWQHSHRHTHESSHFLTLIDSDSHLITKKSNGFTNEFLLDRLENDLNVPIYPLTIINSSKCHPLSISYILKENIKYIHDTFTSIAMPFVRLTTASPPFRWKIRTGAWMCLWGLGISLSAFLFYRLFTHWRERFLSKKTPDDCIHSQLTVHASSTLNNSLLCDELPSSPLVKSLSPSSSAVHHDSHTSSATLTPKQLSEDNLCNGSLISHTDTAFQTLTDLSTRFEQECAVNGLPSWQIGEHFNDLCSDKSSSKPAWSVTGDEAAEQEFLYQCDDMDSFSNEHQPTHSYDCSILSSNINPDSASTECFSFTRAHGILKSSYSTPAKRARNLPDYINEYIEHSSTTWELSSQMTFNDVPDENLDNVSLSTSSSSLISKPLHSSYPKTSEMVSSAQEVDESFSTTASVMSFTAPSFIMNHSHPRYSLANYESLSLQSSPELSTFRRKLPRYFFPHFSPLDASLYCSKDEQLCETEEREVINTNPNLEDQQKENSDIFPSRQERFSSVDFSTYRSSKFPGPSSVATRLSWNDDNVIWKFYHMELQLLRLQREAHSIQMEMNYFRERSSKNIHGIDFVDKKISGIQEIMRQKNTLEFDSCRSADFARIKEIRRLLSSNDSESEFLSGDDLFNQFSHRFRRELNNDLDFQFDRQYIEEHFPEFSSDELDVLQCLNEQTTLETDCY